MSFNSFLKISIGFLFGLIWLSLLVFVYFSFDTKTHVNNIIQSIGTLSTGLSAFIALLAFLWNLVKTKSQDLVKDAILNLERSFEILTQGNESNGPARDRLVWLTSARHIRTFEKIKKKIKTLSDPTQYQILLSHEEYWRSKFYSLLKGLENRGLPEHYYHDPKKEIDENQLALSSLAVIYNFAQWPPDHEDPLINIDHVKIFKETNILLLNPGIKAYLRRRFRKYQEEVHE